MINLNKIPKDYRLFFGDNTVPNLIIGGDSQFKKLAEQSEDNTWFLNVINCSNDKWDELPNNMMRKFRLNISYQTALDTLVPSIFGELSELTNDLWLQYLYSRIKTEENIHAMSYSSAISQAFSGDAESFFNTIYTDKKIQERVLIEIDIANRFIEAKNKSFDENDDNKKILIELLVKTFILEGIKFPFSFFTSWTINKASGNKIQGFSNLLLLIAHDEMTVHTTTGSSLIKKLMKDKTNNFAHIFDADFKKEIKNYFKEAQEKELQWARYLLEDGEIEGFTYDICEYFIKYWTNKRLKEISLEPFENIKQNDIVKWFNDYRNINNRHAALQETDNVSYQKGTLINDLDNFKFE